MYQHSIILFDGVCNLCNGAVKFVIKRDNKNQFLFASLQSGEGKQILEEHNIPENIMKSFFLVENGKVYDRSTAALRVVKRLTGLWPLLYGFIIVPAFIRDGVYNWIAKNRYQWFGKKDECMIPTPELKAKFLN
ncbi:thiol-disulfide oxidoreductase DCC family protein [Ginsengibacter hankyongi]|uniref:Thiol-disulfide oxidoreductase DCC family protein n=1 Tax=Ginsengibacter hankyongi TaxID=2607284 RepID=A0A5J5IL30_9BACT|nr:thiol-disulfide oxidoreductase DCC family protein [Ginsengibacter hankyongi]KAA9041710.1 thiol-disulfide oxidoreductase DCC family protein [Ginsengibacter hankyongi]